MGWPRDTVDFPEPTPWNGDDDRDFELPARTDEQLALDRACTVAVFSIEKFTCDDCPARYTCGFAFDPYNTDGDCLAEK